MLKMIKRLSLALVPLGLLIPIAGAQVTSTQLSPINIHLAYAGQVPANTSTTVSVSCANLNGITGTQTQQAVFGGTSGTVTLRFPLNDVSVGGGSNCTFTVTGNAAGTETVTVGGVVRTGNVPVDRGTDVIVTYQFPSLTVKSLVTGDGPDQFNYVMNCDTPLTPAIFNGQFTLNANGSRTFGVNDIPGVTLNSKCEVRVANSFGGTLSYTSTNGTQTVNGVTSPVYVGGVIVDGQFQSALTNFKGQTITVATGFPVKPTTTTTVAPTTTHPTTTVTTTVPSTTALVTTLPPVVSAAPPVAVIAEPAFTG